ncbi:MAG: MFS transporter [Hyphomicrobiales bacterium]
MTNPAARHARWAVVTCFLLHGILIGSWVPHIPLAKERLEAGPALFGLALLAFAGGAVVAMPVAGMMINRYGSARLTAVTGLLFCLTFFGPILAPDLPLFIVAGFLMGMSIGSMDVAMNAHGIAVEKALRLPTMSMFHGGFSLGGMIGAFMGAALLRAFGEVPQALLTAGLCLVLLLGATRFLLPSSADKGLSGSHFAWPTRATVGLGLLCFLALMIEGSILDWAAIMMREKFLVDAGIAALAFGFYQSGMAVARFTGDRLRLKFGAVRLVVVSALMAAGGTAVALAVPSPAIAILAFIFAGLGIGNVAPILFAGGGRLEPDAPGRGIAAVTTLGYLGFLAGPPLIGFAAQLTSLPVALGLTVLAALIIAAFARMVDAADSF